MKISHADVIQEALQYLARWQGKTLIMSPVSIGSVSRVDLEILAQNIKLLRLLGITIYFALRPVDRLFREVFSSLGCQFLEIADETALVAAAIQTQASKICLICGVDRINTRNGDLDDLSVTKAEQVLSDNVNTLSEEAKSALTVAILACRKGISRVHLFNAHHPGTLLEELFTCRGAGVMIYNEASSYKETRYATPKDALTIAQLLRHIKQSRGEISLDFVLKHSRDFVVFTIDEEIYGCAGLVHSQGNIEVHYLAHTSRFNASEILEAILRFVLEQANKEKADWVAVSANDLPPLMAIMPWFSRLGFVKEESTAIHPHKTWIKRIS